MSSIEFTEHDLVVTALGHEALSGGNELAAAIAKRHRVDLRAMMGPSRLHIYAVARADLYHELRARGWSYPAIGRFVGHRDHTTIMAAVGALRRKNSTTEPDVFEPTCRHCRRTESAHVRKALSSGVFTQAMCIIGGHSFEAGGPRVRMPTIARALEITRRNIQQSKKDARDRDGTNRREA